MSNTPRPSVMTNSIEPIMRDMIFKYAIWFSLITLRIAINTACIVMAHLYSAAAFKPRVVYSRRWFKQIKIFHKTVMLMRELLLTSTNHEVN